MTERSDILGERLVFEGKIVSMALCDVRLPDGRAATRELVHHHGGVGIAAIDGQGRLLLVRQHRWGAGRKLWELPAGKMEPGELPETCGRRELEEETGYRAGRFELLTAVYPTPAYCDEVIYIFYADALTPGEQHLDPDEFLSVEAVPLEEAYQRVLSGDITDAKTQIGILRLWAARQQSKE